ncbi:MAG: DUF924 family protein [Burkholderiales bacterium]
MNSTIARPEDVHRFWFADSVDDPQAADARHSVWFSPAAEFDAEIRQRFEATIAAAARGELSAWETAPRSCVSLVIALDQFPRNVHRGTPAAFAHDALALEVTRRAVHAGHLDTLSVPECAFLLMPYEHVEDVTAQREGMRLFERMHAEAPPQWRDFADGVRQYARGHLGIVERFGRFPHRNAALGRSATAAEREYLESNPNAFGQGGAA